MLIKVNPAGPSILTLPSLLRWTLGLMRVALDPPSSFSRSVGKFPLARSSLSAMIRAETVRSKIEIQGRI